MWVEQTAGRVDRWGEEVEIDLLAGLDDRPESNSIVLKIETKEEVFSGKLQGAWGKFFRFCNR